MKSLAAISIPLLTLAITSVAFAQADSTTVIQRAAAAVPTLRSMMNDPDSFVLIAVHTAINKGVKCDGSFCKHKTPNYVTNLCFTFRSHNPMGGYGQPNVAVLITENEDHMLKGQSGQLLVIGTLEEAETNSGLSLPEWQKTCRSSKFDKDVTAEVKAAQKDK
jgi:hypothetical protein